MKPSPDAPSRLRLVSVNVAQPRLIGTRRGRSVVSGIAKRSVTAETIVLAEHNLEDDRLSVHGGPGQAVYADPTELLPR